MKMQTEYPFEEYDAYLNHHKKMDRMQVCLVHKISKKRKTILYSKYRMSVFLKRILNSDEEVDHIDGNKRNDSIENLQILSRKENLQKSNPPTGRSMVTLICPFCEKEFTREKRQTHICKGGYKTFCSVKCSRKHQFRHKSL